MLVCRLTDAYFAYWSAVHVNASSTHTARTMQDAHGLLHVALMPGAGAIWNDRSVQAIAKQIPTTAHSLLHFYVTIVYIHAYMLSLTALCMRVTL